MPMNNNVGTHHTEGWVSPLATLDDSEKMQYRDPIPFPPIVNPVA